MTGRRGGTPEDRNRGDPCWVERLRDELAGRPPRGPPRKRVPVSKEGVQYS